MKTTAQIDSFGRLVIPKELRRRFGLESGQRIRFVPAEEGITLVPERPKRHFIKRGPILAIDTGSRTASKEAFDVVTLRENRLEEKAHENWR